ncbi:hypothetical protein AHF37_00517 [Paragonimus kellicotti]|nr:hypothetical protein AHF37_00517 [Paragonimus kellicotti]
MTNFTVGYSNFKANRRAAIWIEPMTWMHGHMTNCTFTNHQHGTIRIDNSLDLVKAEVYRSFPVNYIIKNSEFTGNTGPSVIDIRLTELSELQHISLVYNKLIGNSIRIRSNLLNPRSSAPAVIAIGSSHIIVQRNHFWNPESDIEIASHLSASDKRINATMNFWGSLSDWGLTEWGAIHEAVQGKLFDQNHRYTLARIDYHPVLKDPDLQSNFNTINEPPFVPEFIKTDQRSGQIQIGGRIAVERNRQIELTPLADQEAYYHVTKDILVPSGGILVVHPGVRLYFENGLGELKLVGTESMHIQMDLLDRKQTDTLGVLVLPNFTVTETEAKDELPNHLLAYGNRSIRLTGGQWEATIYLGRLELLAPLENDEIPVQSTMHSKEALSGVLCSALGLVAHPKDWFVSGTVRDQIASNADRWANASQMPIHLANLDCQGHETELFQCRGDRALEHSCSHSADVVIRCHRPGWAGVHVTASDPGSRTPIRHVRITNAGLLDYTSTEFVPSLQLDYYSETIVDLQITQGLSHGLQIFFSHPLLGAAILDSRITNNFETGLLTRTSSLKVHRCRLEHNLLGAGLEYNPVMTPQDMFTFHSGFVQTLTLFSQKILTGSQQETLPEGWQLITAREKLHPTGITFANVPSGHLYEKTIYRTELMADDPHRMHQIILHLLDFPVVNCPTSKDQAAVTPNATIGPLQLLPGLLPASNVPCHTLRCLPLEGNTVEELIIFDGPMDNNDPDRLYSWHIPRDLVRLPLISAGPQLTIEFRIHGIRSGNLLFALETRDFQHTQQPRQFPGSGADAHYAAFQFEPDTRYSPIPNLVVQDTVVQQNAAGLRLHHYNDPLDGWDRLFWRHTAEVFTMSNVSLIKNRGVAIHIPSASRFAQDWYLPSYAENSQTTERLSFIAYRLENCLLTDNAGGSILAEHNHVEFANNVWSYHASNCSFRRNGHGSTQADPVVAPSQMIVNSKPKGLVFQLPFVSTQFDWRYQPITAHRLQFLKNGFHDNHQFTFVVDGYHAQVELTENTFENNACQEILPDQGSVQQGLLHFKGMEKSLQMLNNRFVRNHDCQFILQLHGLSQAPTAETVTAHLARNIFKRNTCFSVRFNQSGLANPGMCYTVGFFGTQNGTLRHNVFDNQKLLNTATTEAQSVHRITDPIRIGTLGGRLTSNLHLIYREEPYRVYSDLTVMPGCELRIDAGVKLEFAPHVGLLVLGRLVARGFRSQPIRFGPIPVQSSLPNRPPSGKSSEMKQVKSEHPRVVGSEDATTRVVGRVGLTTSFVRLLGGERADEGFVHFYNSTAQRWDVACDPQFSIEVVCQELGQPTLNAIVRASRLYDFQLYGFENPLVQKHVWMESYVCHGFETHRHQCIRRLNYDHVRCLRHQEFVFLRCAALPSGPEFINSDLALYTWGNVRIVLNEDENDLVEVATDEKARQSVLEYVRLERAGLLHGQRVAALTTVYAYPRLSFINITNCFGDGFELINPRGFIDISNTSVSGCLGRAISMTVLNGDSTDPTTYGLSSTQILGIPTLLPQQGSLLPPPRPSPGQPVGTVAADLVSSPCVPERKLSKLLIDYWFSTNTAGLVHMLARKYFDLIVPGRRLAWRFLAVKLYHDPFVKNTLELYNGANFNTSYLIAEVTANMLDNHSVPVGERFTFVTSSIHDILGVHLHTSPASNRFGFIAEVITLPISPERTYPELNKQMRHRIEVCEFQANQGGGIHIQSVGENGPDLYLANLRVMENGLQLLNLTGPPAIDIRVTNTFNLAISNSYFFRHSGHVIRARLYASQVTRGARMNITNNAIVRSRFGGALVVEGNHFNTLLVIRNYIAHNDCGQRDLVRIAGVLARPFAYNFIHDNRGAVLLNCSGEEQLSHGSRFEFNGFYKNEALNYTRRTTVFSDNSKNQFRDNYFRNNANSYELVVGNRSIISVRSGLSNFNTHGTKLSRQLEEYPHSSFRLRLEFDACLCYRPDSLDARLNWWGDTVSDTSDHRKMDGVPQADGSRGSVAENRAQSFAREVEFTTKTTIPI